MRIPISRPWFGAEEAAAAAGPLETGWVVQGPCVHEFEEKFASFADVVHAAATTSCTTALHLAVAALGLRAGDEVIVPAFTWISTANVVEYMGATPVFCDIDLETFNVNIDAVERAVTSRTVGIIPVHLFGLCADMDRLGAIAARHNLWIVEDAACGFGARIRGRHCGAFGDIGCFSFHPRKAITTGEGGMTTTADRRIDETIRSLRDHGATRSDFVRHSAAQAFLLPDYPRLGYNCRMTDIQGAIGSVQLDRAGEILRRRRMHAARYDELLAGADWLSLPVSPPGYEHAYQAYVCLFRPEPPGLHNVDALQTRRNALMTALEAEGIATRQGTHAAALTQYYADRYSLRRQDFPNACIAEKLTVALPLFAQLRDEDIRVVCDALAAHRA